MMIGWDDKRLEGADNGRQTRRQPRNLEELCQNIITTGLTLL